MKKILLLSVLILFSCSKDTLVPANSGNKIIGNYQLVQQISVEQAEFSVWAASSPTTVTGRTNVTGKVIFSSDSTGYFDIIVDGSKNIRVNFDWSFDGTKWSVADSNSNSWQISYCNSLYIMNSRSDGGKMSNYNYRLIF